MRFEGARLVGYSFAGSDLRGTGVRLAASVDGTTSFHLAKLDAGDRAWLRERGFLGRRPEPGLEKPEWADTIGRDRFGVFVTIKVPALEGEPVVQRMRWIPPGRFLMGSADDDPLGRKNERPQHEVVIGRGFWLFDTPCTQALWTAVMGDNRSHFKGPNRPVERVSWNDVQSFLSRLEGRFGLTLPSEAQWEYACRAGTQAAPVLDDVAWFRDNSGKQTHDVGTKAANALGVYDMLGNVWEWCADSWHATYVDVPADGRAWMAARDGAADRVLRGGSWESEARLVRSAYRSRHTTATRNIVIGFRCARVE